MNTDTHMQEVQTEKTALTGVESKFAVAKRVIAAMRQQLDHLERLLNNDVDAAEVDQLVRRMQRPDGELLVQGGDARIVEGVFDGESMVGEDGQRYLVPPNYASKSKLVEGDLLRLTILGNGKFLFKQRGPVERHRMIGTLVQDDRTNDWKVMANGQTYRVLTASVTFYRGASGDEAVILTPEGAPSKWAAVENIIKRDLDAFRATN